MKIEAFEVEYHPEFDKEVDRFITKKRFKKLPDQIEGLVAEFEKGNFSGTPIISRDSPIEYEKLVVLLTIYYKKEKGSISESYIAALIDGYFLHSLPEED